MPKLKIFDGKKWIDVSGKDATIDLDPFKKDLTNLKNKFNYYQVSAAGGSGGTSSLTVGTSAITSGTANRVLFEGAGNVLQEDADFNYDSGALAKTLTVNRVASSRALVIAPWQAATVYLANDIVQNGNSLYKRIAGGTSGATFDATEESAWNLFGLSTTGTIAPWQPSFYYEVGEVVTNNGSIYRTTTTHTSAATFTAAEQTNFSAIGNYTDIDPWAPTTVYPQGKLFSQSNGRIIRGTTSRTSGATFNATEAAFYEVVKQLDLNPWTANSVYYASELAKYNGGIIRSGSLRTTGATFNATEAAFWLNDSNYTNVVPFSASTFYYAGTLVSTGQRIVKRTADGTTGASFDNTEAALYTLVKGQFNTGFPATTYIYQNERMLVNGSEYSRTASGITGAAFDATEALNWTLVQNYTDVTTPTNGDYVPAGKLIPDGTRILKRTTAGIAVIPLTNAERANYTLVSSTGTTAFAGTTYYYANELVTINQKVVKRITSGVSAGTFSLAESLNWTLVTYTPSAWLATTVYYQNEIVYAPVTQDLILGSGGFTGAVFDSVEVTNNGWIVKVTNANPKAFVASTYYFAGDVVTNTDGTVYRCATGHVSNATMTAAELSFWAIAEGNPNTSVATAYSVVETDDMIDIVSGAAFTITIPANRVNPIIKFSTTSLSATPPIISADVGETIINPVTFASVTSFPMPGSTGLASQLTFQKVGTQWRFIA